MTKKFTIELSEKELYVLWAIACWFNKPLVTTVLKHKLSDLAFRPERKKYTHLDKLIEERIIDLGSYLEEKAVE